MQVGSIIKAFDFPGNLNCYFVGRVQKIAGGIITAEIIKQVFDGKDVTDRYEVGDTFSTPKQGMSFMDEKFERVVLVG